MTARDDILAQLGVIAQQSFAAQQNFLGNNPDRATEDADLANVQHALTTLIALVDAYDFGGALRVVDLVLRGQFECFLRIRFRLG